MSQRVFSRRRFIQGAAGASAALAIPARLSASSGARTAASEPAASGAAPLTVARRFAPLVPRFPHLLHGGDYNPDQWLERPDILQEDIRLMEKAGCNTFSVAIFAWVRLEPEEGRYTFDWLDGVLDRIAAKGWNVLLATPSGAKPQWLSLKYPEIKRVGRDGRRALHGSRHDHCQTSPVYRRKVEEINSRLAERYAKHPALAGWHVSNEYNGDCFCDLCLSRLRDWLRARYGSLEALNQAYWSGFWSQRFTAWEQIEPRETPLDGLRLDWLRFTTDQTVDFMKHEVAPLRRLTPDKLVTTNMMGTFHGLDYWRFADVCDRMSWDAYLFFHDDNAWKVAVGAGFTHDIYRAMKGGRPFILMDSTPSSTNWHPTPSLKQPGQHEQEMLLALGHGADATMYFQWRKGRGGFEKFHGAVVDHEGSEQGRVFQDVAAHGALLKKLDAIVGTSVQPEVAVLFDWEVRWALATSEGPRQSPNWNGWGPFDKEYNETAIDHYRPFWKLGIPVDVIESTRPFDGYKLVVAPMLYLLKPGVAERLRAFVQGGGALVLTYLSGIVNETNLCFQGGWPGDGLRELAGVWAEELDSIGLDSPQRLVAKAGNALGLTGAFPLKTYCDRIHAEGAEVLATYQTDFYAGQPALTVNRFGRGRCYYLAARPADDSLHDALVRGLVREIGLTRALDVDLPEGTTVQMRSGDGEVFLFLHNFRRSERAVDLKAQRLTDLVTGEVLSGKVTLPPFASRVLRKG
jgi:beta-galactosidase